MPTAIYDYAVIRVVPRVEREEFVNVGVIVSCQSTGLLEAAGARLGPGRAVVVDDRMWTGLPHVRAAGDGVVTHHRLLGVTYLPLGTTAHKQGRVAGENAVGGDRVFAGSVGTQVVKVFDLVAARTGLRDDEALAAGFEPRTAAAAADDHKRYYPGAHPIELRVTAHHTCARKRAPSAARLPGVAFGQIGLDPTERGAGQQHHHTQTHHGPDAP